MADPENGCYEPECREHPGPLPVDFPLALARSAAGELYSLTHNIPSIAQPAGILAGIVEKLIAERQGEDARIRRVLDELDGRLVFNSHDLGELGTFIRAEYVRYFFQSVRDELLGRDGREVQP